MLTSHFQQIYNNVEYAKTLGIAHIVAEDVIHEGKMVAVKGRNMLNFSSCSYMGLETDERLKQAAKAAIDQYGVAFSSSRAYLGIGILDELEKHLEQVYDHPTLVMPSTTMAHLSVLPLVIGSKDAVILDHQVHSSVQFSIKIASSNGAYVESIRHNRMDYLENRIKKLQGEYEKVWYLADGVYSMYGDTAPMSDLHWLLDNYENFHLYIDDAHGMSWTGENGSGYVLSSEPYHDKMVLVTSLYKGFGTGGAAIICRDRHIKQLIKDCGGTFIFSGPMHPATIGAAIESAKIHLSPEINNIQADLNAKMNYFRHKINENGLPLVSKGDTPIFYLAAGKLEVGYSICKMLIEKGFVVNVAAYPSVPTNNTGVRMMVNAHHSYEDLDALIEALLDSYSVVTEKQNFNFSAIQKVFKL